MTKPHVNKAPKGRPVSFFEKSASWYLIIPLLTLGVYYSVTNFELVNWDDKLYVKETPMVHGLTMEHVKEMFTKKVLLSYNPVVLLTFAVDYEIAKLDPGWSHGVNLFFHLLNGLLVFACMRKLKFRADLAGFVALLFSIHPLSVQAVAWVAGRKDMIYGFFFLAAWLFYLKSTESRKWINYSLSVFFFILALLSKVQAVTLPFVLIISDYILSGKLPKKYADKIPFFLLSIAFGIIAVSGSTLVADKYAAIPTFSDKIVYSLMAVGMYLYKLIIPLTQNAIYTFPEPGTSDYYTLLIGGIITTALLIGAVIYSFRRAPVFAGGLLFFMVSIFVVLHIVAFNSSLIYERFVYLASIGIFISIVHLHQLFPKWSKYRTNVLVPAAVVLGIIGYIRVQVWKDAETLWTDVINGNPTAAVGWNNRGMVYSDRGDYDKAFEDFNQCITVKPQHPDAYNNRSTIYFHKKDYQKALEDNLKVLNIDSNHKDGYGNRGSYFFTIHQYDSAEYYYHKAVNLNKKNANAWFFAGVASYNRKEYAKATKSLKQAVDILPGYADAYVFMGMAYARLGQKDSALWGVGKAEEISSISIARQSVAKEYLLMGTEVFNKGDSQGALSLYNTALEIKPNDADALYYIGGIYLSRQDVVLARQYWTKSLTINPEQKEAKEWLARIGK